VETVGSSAGALEVAGLIKKTLFKDEYLAIFLAA
jgi:hypothetical protein